MGREVRRVPADWQHPRGALGDYIPLFGGSFSKSAAIWDEQAAKWKDGLRDDWKGGWQVIEPEHAHLPFEEWDGPRPVESDYMPDWPEELRTHYQMYEDTSEGTPISPVMASPKSLALWLAASGASSFGNMTATYEHWLAMIEGSGSSVSMVMTVKEDGSRTIQSGVEAMGERK